jgi:hypothetical protein
MSWTEAANSAWFWALLIGGLAVIYFLPVIVALIRQAEHLGIIVMLNMFPLLWPGALAGAFILPRRQPPAPPLYAYLDYDPPDYYPPVQYAPPGSWY